MKEAILSLGKDSIIYGVGSVVTRFIGFLLLPLYTSYLDPEAYGVLAMLSILTMVAQPVFSLGLGAAMGPSYFDASSVENKSRVVWSAFVINFVSAGLLLCLAWSIPAYLGRLVLLSPEYSGLVSISLTGCALTVLSTSLALRVQFEKQARRYVMITLVTTFVATLLSVLTVVILEWGVSGMVMAQMAANVVTAIVFLLFVLKELPPRFDYPILKELLRLGIPFVPSFIFVFILMHANKYILEWYEGLEVVGVYSIGFNLGTVLSVVTGGIAMAWYPFFMSYMERQYEAEMLFGKILTYYVFGIGFLCVMFFIFANPLVKILTQEAYYGAYKVIGFVSLAYFLQGMFSFFLPGLYFQKEIKYVSGIQGLAALLSIIASFFLIVNFGMVGAALGLVMGNLLMVLMLLFWNYFRRNEYLNIVYEWKRISIFVFSIAFILLGNHLVSDLFWVFELVKCGVIILSVTAILYALLNQAEKSFLRSKLAVVGV